MQLLSSHAYLVIDREAHQLHVADGQHQVTYSVSCMFPFPSLPSSRQHVSNDDCVFLSLSFLSSDSLFVLGLAFCVFYIYLNILLMVV